MESSTWYVIKQRLAWIKMHETGASVSTVCRHYGAERQKRIFHGVKGVVGG